MVDAQTIDLTGLISRFNGSLSLDGEPLNFLVEEDGEGLAWPGVDLVVGLDVELVEERLVGDASQGVVDAQVQLMAVPSEGE